MTRAALAGLARPFAAPLVVLAAHAAALRALDALDVVARLLGAAAAPPVLPVVLLASFYVLRLAAVFVAPGWLALALVRAVVRARDPRA